MYSVEIQKNNLAKYAQRVFHLKQDEKRAYKSLWKAADAILHSRMVSRTTYLVQCIQKLAGDNSYSSYITAFRRLKTI